jgi:hypothetical protein
MANKPKEPTYGELVNMRTALSAQKKAIKANFPNDKVKITKTLPNGEKLSLKQVKQKIAEMDARPGKKMTPAKPVPVAGMKPAAKTKPVITKTEKKIEKQLSPKGMKANEKMQNKATDKKYPGLYKKKAN